MKKEEEEEEEEQHQQEFCARWRTHIFHEISALATPFYEHLSGLIGALPCHPLAADLHDVCRKNRLPLPDANHCQFWGCEVRQWLKAAFLNYTPEAEEWYLETLQLPAYQQGFFQDWGGQGHCWSAGCHSE